MSMFMPQVGHSQSRYLTANGAKSPKKQTPKHLDSVNEKTNSLNQPFGDLDMSNTHSC